LATNSDNFTDINKSLDSKKIYQWDGFSFKYPSDGKLTTTNEVQVRIMNYTPDEPYNWMQNWGFFISISSTNQQNNCFDYMQLNKNWEPLADEWSSTLKSTSIQNGIIIYDSIPRQAWESVAQWELCFKMPNKPLYLIAYGANWVDIENIIKESLKIL
jgi:hypothetical protein